MELTTPVAAIRRGYLEVSSAERTSFGILSSFASTILAGRAINYVREQRRPMPRARSLWRRIYNAPRTGGVRVHHFVPGVAVSFAAGGIAIVTRTDGLRFGVPFGIGTGLALDELALLIDVDNPYWGSERLALIEAATAALAAAALGARFGWRGGALRRNPTSPGGT